MSEKLHFTVVLEPGRKGEHEFIATINSKALSQTLYLGGRTKRAACSKVFEWMLETWQPQNVAGEPKQ